MPAKPWKRIEPTVVTKIDRRTVVIKTFETDGETRAFATYHAENQRSGAVIALTKDKKVIVAKQFRPGPEKMMAEIPGGGLNAGEDPEAGVMRELKEETGYVSDNVTFLGTSGRDAYTNAIWYYYLALDCELSAEGQNLDEDEEIDVELISIEAFLQSAKNDMMTDPAAVLMAYDKLKQLQEEADGAKSN